MENLSEEELELMKQYQKVSASKPNLMNRLAVEVIPPAFFVYMGIQSQRIHWFVIVIAILVFYNVFRVIRQNKNIETLNSISEKVIGKFE